MTGKLPLIRINGSRGVVRGNTVKIMGTSERTGIEVNGDDVEMENNKVIEQTTFAVAIKALKTLNPLK